MLESDSNETTSEHTPGTDPGETPDGSAASTNADAATGTANASAQPDFEAEAQALCASLDRTCRALLGDAMPARAQTVEIQSLKAQLCDLVERAAGSAGSAAGELERLERELAAAKQEAIKAKADFINYQERARRDLAAAEESILRSYMSDLLPMLDGFEFAVKDAEREGADLNTVRDGLKMIQESLETTLLVRGLKKIEATGQPFDPNLHESAASVPPPTPEHKAKTVLETARPGYLWKDKLLRPAQVVIVQG